jgi:uncharacterized membrane protein
MTFILQHTVLKFFVESLWRDEAFSWAMASHGLGAVALTARDFNPPLYYLLLYAWMQVVGPSEMAMRSLSVVCFCGTLLVVRRFMTDILAIPGRRTWPYLLLFALNPALLYYAVEARMYSLLALLAVASFYAYLARKPVVYVLATTAGLYTHYFMALVILTQIASTMMTERAADRRRQLMSAFAPVALFAPWAVAMAWTGRSDQAFWVDYPAWRFTPHLLTSIYTGHDATYGFLERGERWLFVVGLAPIVCWSLLSGLRPSQSRPALVHVALWALVPPALVFAASFVKPIFVPRYLIFSAVGLLLLLVVGLERARPLFRYAMLAVLCALAGYYQAAQADRHTKGEYRDTIRRIAAHSASTDVLCVSSALDFFPAQYYYDETRVFILGMPYDRIPSYVGKVLIPKARVLDAEGAGSIRGFLLKNDREYAYLAATIAAAR